MTSIVVTTIFEPAFLSGYLDALRGGHFSENTNIIIIPDRKTPASVSRAAMTAKREGFHVLCPTLDEQETFLRRLRVPANFIPYDTDNRRNVGFLMALEQGCDVLISIDDDNFCQPGVRFVEDHQVVGFTAPDPVVHTSDGWFNICTLLNGEKRSTGSREVVCAMQQNEAETLFPRGFPYFAQHTNRRTELVDDGERIPIAMNAGLWLDEPDVDAVHRLCRRPKIVERGGLGSLDRRQGFISGKLP